VDSLRVFPFLASIRGSSRSPSVSKDKVVEHRNDVGTYHEERHFDVALLQNVKQPVGVTDTWFRK
jgi:hypothetical protein